MARPGKPKPSQPVGTPEIIISYPALVNLDGRAINLAHVGQVNYVIENGVAIIATLYMTYLTPTSDATLSQEEIQLEGPEAEAFRRLVTKLSFNLEPNLDAIATEIIKKPVIYLPR